MTKLPTIIREVRDSYNLNFVKSLVITDTAQVIPTPCGLPVTIRADGVGMVGVHGNLRVEGLETLHQFIRAPRTNSLPLMKFFTDLKTRYLYLTLVMAGGVRRPPLYYIFMRHALTKQNSSYSLHEFS